MDITDMVLDQQQVPLMIEQSCLDLGDMSGQPLAIPEEDELVPPAVEEQDRNGNIGQLEPPWPGNNGAVVVPQSLAAGREPVMRRGPP
jgi:hypothetical protein